MKPPIVSRHDSFEEPYVDSESDCDHAEPEVSSFRRLLLSRQNSLEEDDDEEDSNNHQQRQQQQQRQQKEDCDHAESESSSSCGLPLSCQISLEDEEEDSNNHQLMQKQQSELLNQQQPQQRQHQRRPQQHEDKPEQDQEQEQENQKEKQEQEEEQKQQEQQQEKQQKQREEQKQSPQKQEWQKEQLKRRKEQLKRQHRRLQQPQREQQLKQKRKRPRQTHQRHPHDQQKQQHQRPQRQRPSRHYSLEEFDNHSHFNRKVQQQQKQKQNNVRHYSLEVSQSYKIKRKQRQKQQQSLEEQRPSTNLLRSFENQNLVLEEGSLGSSISSDEDFSNSNSNNKNKNNNNNNRRNNNFLKPQAPEAQLDPYNFSSPRLPSVDCSYFEDEECKEEEHEHSYHDHSFGSLNEESLSYHDSFHDSYHDYSYHTMERLGTDHTDHTHTDHTATEHTNVSESYDNYDVNNRRSFLSDSFGSFGHSSFRNDFVNPMNNPVLGRGMLRQIYTEQNTGNLRSMNLQTNVPVRRQMMGQYSGMNSSNIRNASVHNIAHTRRQLMLGNHYAEQNQTGAINRRSILKHYREDSAWSVVAADFQERVGTFAKEKIFVPRPRLYFPLLHVIIPLIFLVDMCFLFGYWLAVLESPQEMTSNDDALRQFLYQVAHDAVEQNKTRNALLQAAATASGCLLLRNFDESNDDPNLCHNQQHLKPWFEEMDKQVPASGSLLQEFNSQFYTVLLELDVLSFHWITCPRADIALMDEVLPPDWNLQNYAHNDKQQQAFQYYLNFIESFHSQFEKNTEYTWQDEEDARTSETLVGAIKEFLAGTGSEDDDDDDDDDQDKVVDRHRNDDSPNYHGMERDESYSFFYSHINNHTTTTTARLESAPSSSGSSDDNSNTTEGEAVTTTINTTANNASYSYSYYWIDSETSVTTARLESMSHTNDNTNILIKGKAATITSGHDRRSATESEGYKELDTSATGPIASGSSSGHDRLRRASFLETKESSANDPIRTTMTTSSTSLAIDGQDHDRRTSTRDSSRKEEYAPTSQMTSSLEIEAKKDSTTQIATPKGGQDHDRRHTQSTATLVLFEDIYKKSLEEAVGSKHCQVNLPGGAIYWFTIMTTIGFGNTATQSVWGRTLVYTAGFLSIIIFTTVSSHAGRVVCTLSDDIFKRMKLKALYKPTFLSVTYWFALFWLWIVAYGTYTYLWNKWYIGPVEITNYSYRDSIWYAYITFTTVGFGDYYIPHEEIIELDVFLQTLIVLFGFVCLTNFAIRLSKYMGHLSKRMFKIPPLKQFQEDLRDNG